MICKTQRNDLHGPVSCNHGSLTLLMVLNPQRQHARTTALQQLSHAELKAHGNTCVKLHVQQAFLMQAVRQRTAASAGRMFDAWEKKREDLPM